MKMDQASRWKCACMCVFLLAGQTVSLASVSHVQEELYTYQPLYIEIYGPAVPELDQLGRQGFLNHVRAASLQDQAGGYTSGLACHRAIQDAFSGLFSL
ncbi:hypothetical protein DNTS_015753 [Danionella cerebrum]|uniref:MAT1 C-terminal CAK anchor domain-containing protein n=1 Tax=Danionella cerebrum TaxID=2873325 RepID=A0A553MQ23_9TELE|nr:hypothetical protein DNTS_015753 [Danionella translucida]